MKELMLRLIKDGKIVGYATIPPDEKMMAGGHLIGIYTNIDKTNRMWGVKPDSFDLGIKVGDEWWFNNDRISTEQYGGVTTEWILHIEIGCDLWVERGEIWDMVYRIADTDFKRIGTIYDEVKP